jgi:choline dehydrogenase-like flavoprotein
MSPVPELPLDARRRAMDPTGDAVPCREGEQRMSDEDTRVGNSAGDPANSYDVVIVGAGAAGCVLAARLVEAGGARVLLLEAGSAQPLEAMTAPPAWFTLMQSSASWGEMTTVQAATGTATLLPRGRALGGSTAINAMGFIRGHRSSYDAWAADGATGWGFDDLLPYFKRSEDARDRDPALRGVGGPLVVGPADPANHPVMVSCLAAAAEAGHRQATDISGGVELGFGWLDLNIVDGRRQTAADAYLSRVTGSPHLDVVTDALVHRLRIERGRCTGVEYSVGGRPAVASAGEVVLTAGSIGTAQLLMLSGVGPQDHLRAVGVTPVLDLPGVGANLHDHPITYLVYVARRPVPPGRDNHCEALGLVRGDPALEAPNLQMVFVDVPLHLPEGEPPTDGYSIGVSVMSPRSRGTVRLADADPGSSPVLDPNYFGDDRDMDTMITGLRLAREIGQASALDDWRNAEVGPGPDITDDEGLRGYVRRTLASYSHPVGTCRMGTDPLAVVDLELRVHGIDGLRIADSSVIPSIPSANTAATVYGIAERAAELIRS